MSSNPNINVGDIDSAAESVAAEDAEETPEEKYRKLFKRFHEVSDDLMNLKEENHKLRMADDTSKVLNQLINPMANKAFSFMCFYSGTVALFLMLRGLSGKKFDLSDAVLQILVGSTAVTVIGLVGMVLTGVFVGARRG